uniref:phosphatidyl-N-methylethanolamine N-methyltransferase n=1 Tax=Aplanochytrium stocchinoi TaxID=215587 RepID=A0A7S3LI74_9STRA|mmetsp:Transcript_2178/g.2795  ORF Transcript_2178/g.2795 Transcript_2178/m.2795 type:complete len:175 (+) Transcript_2178:131-655(+)
MDYISASLLLSLERLAYGVVWKQPHVFSKIAKKAGYPGKEPEFIFNLVRLFKLVQIYVFATWYYTHYGTSVPSLTTTQFMVGLPILAFGQLLNFMVWYRIGIDGVCYGCKFGRSIPWCTQFPYSHFNHPQYLGAILTVWGMFIFCWQDCPYDWYAIPVIETSLYICSMYYWEAN